MRGHLAAHVAQWIDLEVPKPMEVGKSQSWVPLSLAKLTSPFLEEHGHLLEQRSNSAVIDSLCCKDAREIIMKTLRAVIAAFKAEKASMLEKLAAMFTERPIWTSLDLRERVSGLAPHEIELVSKHAYMFRSGEISNGTTFTILWESR